MPPPTAQTRPLPSAGSFQPEEYPIANKEVRMTKVPGFRTWALVIPCSIFNIPFFGPTRSPSCYSCHSWFQSRPPQKKRTRVSALPSDLPRPPPEVASDLRLTRAPSDPGGDFLERRGARARRGFIKPGWPDRTFRIRRRRSLCLATLSDPFSFSTGQLLAKLNLLHFVGINGKENFGNAWAGAWINALNVIEVLA